MNPYRPSSSVVALRAFPVSLFLTETIARVITPPGSSRTTPESAAVGVCAKETLAVNNSVANRLFVHCDGSFPACLGAEALIAA